MAALSWDLNNILIRQPLLGTGKCIERRVNGAVWLSLCPMPGTTLCLRASAYYPPMKIKVDTVEMNAASTPSDCNDMPGGEIISNSMILLPTNESPDSPDGEFYKALYAIGAPRQPLVPEEIVPIDCDQWLRDGCLADAPDQHWFDGMMDGEGYSQEFILTREGREQFAKAKDIFAARSLSKMRID